MRDGCPSEKVHDLVAGRRNIDPQMAEPLFLRLGIDPQYWINLQLHAVPGRVIAFGAKPQFCSYGVGAGLSAAPVAKFPIEKLVTGVPLG